MSESKGRLREGLSRWASHSRDEARDLQRTTERAGLLCIADAPDREMVVLQGKLRTVTLRPRGGVPALEAELYDGTGSITVLWLGRRRIAGIFPGRTIRIEGRVASAPLSTHDKERIMYNPRYELKKS